MTGTRREVRTRSERLRVAALYSGGFLGPFGGALVASMLPEMGDSLGISTGSASSSLTAYLLPFALTMLVSGTLGARWGRLRTVRIAYGVYTLASIVCALAPTLQILLAARVVQGCGNAFTTPLLLATLAAATPRERLGRVLGTFGALQAAGQTSAPLVGGVAAQFDWRYAFVVLAVVSAVLGLVGLPRTDDATSAAPRERLRDALRPHVVRIGLVALLGWGALGGLNFMLAYRAEDVFGLNAPQRGVLLTVFGLTGILTARAVGRLIDRLGSGRTVVVGAVAGAALVAVAGTAPALWAVGVAWALAGVASQFVLVGVNAAVLGGGANRGGAVSVVQAFRFSGAALAPLALTPLYLVRPAAGFLVPALLLAVVAPIAMPRAAPPDRGSTPAVSSS
ncbi:MFS transporter [Rhodococcus sp. Eu-32]|uniref:MFS transporter n=1 Tax=Rhodococcus sp. Eu-32 TaxID=1017319 RepID=UPI000DF3C17C|nr:MFS transporter [Rhodococcus sp. Eu-32]RRQ28744.1 MFS transporter [Rhodococcus sp. Eu-32]